MRVALASMGMSVGGAERLVLTLAAELLARGHDVAVSGPEGPLDAELAALAAERVVLPERGRSAVGAAEAALRLAAAMRRWRPEALHAHNPKMTAVSAAAARLAGGRRPRVVATYHGVHERDHRRGVALLRSADVVACVSRDTAAALAAAGLPSERLVVVPNAIAPHPPIGDRRRAALDAELELGPGPVVAAVGRLVAQKNHLRLLDALAPVAAVHPDLRVLIVGEGPLRAALEARRDALGLAAHVRLTGVRDDVRELLERADVLVFSSDFEGMSVAALEAMAAGTPVVSTPVQGMRELLEDGAGVVVASFEPAALSEALLALLADPERRAAMGAAGRAAVAARHSIPRMVDAYERLYSGRLTPAA